jgi:hypothetical protein
MIEEPAWDDDAPYHDDADRQRQEQDERLWEEHKHLLKELDDLLVQQKVISAKIEYIFKELHK